jgi:CTP synthase
LGLQIAVIEFARHVLKLDDANSTEFNPDTEDPVIDFMEDQRRIAEKGATMRLGAYDCRLRPGTHAAKAYGAEMIRERHRHRYEVNNHYVEMLGDAGMVFSGVNPQRDLVEIIELRDHPWFVGVQFHPEFQSKPNKAHPLFASFIKAALRYQAEAGSKPAAKPAAKPAKKASKK